MPWPAARAPNILLHCQLLLTLDNAIPVATSDQAFTERHEAKILQFPSRIGRLVLRSPSPQRHLECLTLDATERDPGTQLLNLPLNGRENGIVDLSKAFESEPLPQQLDIASSR